MARKLPRLQRVLDAPALFSIAYGEIASSIYFALGIIALYALGFTPLVLLVVAIAVVGLSAFPPAHGRTELGSTWVRSPLMGIVARLRDHLPGVVGAPLQVFVGLSGATILLMAATTSISGFGRLAYSLGEHGQLPRRFGWLNQRTLVAPQSIVAAAVIAIGILAVTAPLTHPVFFLASLFSFGVLLAFTAAQLAVIKLRTSEPERRRPYRVPLTIGRVPLPSLLGAGLTIFIWVVALATHAGARYGGPAWLAFGLVVYVAVRKSRGEGLLQRVVSADEHRGLAEAEFSRILVPMKLGEIGEEMIATAVKLAQERGASVEALHVIRVPLDLPLDAELVDEEERAEASIAEAKLLGADHGVTVEGKTVRARSIGQAIVEEAQERGADLIVLGSSPRWRRQSRFFSPTVDYVLKKAPSEVLIVAFPQGVLEADGAGQ